MRLDHLGGNMEQPPGGPAAESVEKLTMTLTKMGIWMLGLVVMPAGLCGSGFCDPAAAPTKDSQLPSMQLSVPALLKDRQYLGIHAKKTFRFTDVKADLIMLEIIGVYCPQCHRQRPHINRLYHRIQKVATLADKIKFMGIAAGATPMEVAYLVKEAGIPYPIITDENFEIHKQLGEPRTPFNIVTTTGGKVLWVHKGIIEDMDALFTTLKSLAGR